MLLPWLFLVLTVTGNFFPHLGWHYLFLDPEYFGRVNFISFFIIGVALGGFIFLWNITDYILNSYRFAFLASFENPFLRFSLNNFFFPLVFVVIYFYSLIQFQYYSELKSLLEVISYQIALISGMMLMLVVSFFRSLNVHAEKLSKQNKTPLAFQRRVLKTWLFEGKAMRRFSTNIRVDYVLVHPFR